MGIRHPAGTGAVGLGDFSCPDWFERLQAGKPPLPENLPIDQEEARLAVEAFKRLRLPDVPGTPLLRDTAGQWALDFVSAIFGLVVMNEARDVVIDRKARRFFQLVPKKNSKTTNGAAIMLTAMLRNRRPNAEFLLVGPTQATAELAYEQAEGMVNADPWLKKRFHTREHMKTIEDRTNGAKLRIRSFDTKVMTGAKPVGVLVDELHEIGTMNGARKVMSQIDGGIVANPEGFVIIITTQSMSPPVGVFAEELKQARAVRDGEYGESETLPMLYELPLEMQEDDAKPWEDPKIWPLVLPNLNRSITIDRLLPKFKEAKAAGVESLSIWGSQHLNLQIGSALHAANWRGAPYWVNATDPERITLASLIDRSEVITAGVDGGGLDDLLGLGLCGRDAQSKDWLFWYHAWAQPDVLERRKDIADRLREFEEDGTLTIFDEPNRDVHEVADIMESVFNAGLFPEKLGIGLDAYGISEITDEIVARGIPLEMMGAVPQGFKLNGVIKGFERRLKFGTLWHDGSRMMTWCVGNAKTEVKGSATLITKQISGSAKIDPLMAGFDAYFLMARNPVASGHSVYSSRGALVL